MNGDELRRLATLEGDLADVQKNLHNMTEEIVELKSAQTRLAAQTAALAELSGLAEQFGQLRVAFTDMRGRLETLPTEDLRPAIDKISQQLAELERRIAEIEKRVTISTPIILE